MPSSAADATEKRSGTWMITLWPRAESASPAFVNTCGASVTSQRCSHKLDSAALPTGGWRADVGDEPEGSMPTTLQQLTRKGDNRMEQVREPGVVRTGEGTPLWIVGTDAGSGALHKEAYHAVDYMEYDAVQDETVLHFISGRQPVVLRGRVRWANLYRDHAVWEEW